MELGISTYTFPWAVGINGFEPEKKLTPFDLLLTAKHFGISRLQIGDNFPLHLLDYERLISLKQEAGKLKIQLEVGTRRLTADNLLRYLVIAESLHSPFLRVVIDDQDFHPSPAEVKEIIKAVIPQFRQKNVILAIENHDRFPAYVLEDIICDTDKEFVGICLDTANSLGAGEGINEIMKVLAPYTVNLHIKDITITRLSHKMGFMVQGCAAGKGDLDIINIIKTIKTNGKCKSVTLELWSDFQKDIKTTIENEKKWAEESISYLKKLI